MIDWKIGDVFRHTKHTGVIGVVHDVSGRFISGPYMHVNTEAIATSFTPYGTWMKEDLELLEVVCDPAAV